MLVCLFASVASSACWATAPGIDPPSVVEPVSELEQLSVRLESIYAVLERDVTRMGTLRVEFFSPPAPLYADPFPLDLFRHVALTCLNELPTEDLSRAEGVEEPLPEEPDPESEPPGEEASGEDEIEPSEDALEKDRGGRPPLVQLTCQPANLDFLFSKIPATRLEFAAAQMKRVDEVRTLRLRIERRIARLPRILAAASAQIAEKRAARRQLAEQVNKRKLDYNKDQWDESMRRLKRYEKEILRSERALEVLQKQLELEQGWLERAREEMNIFLYDLVWLGLDEHSPKERGLELRKSGEE